MSEKSDLYMFNMSLFDNIKPEEFLFFIRNFWMTLEDLGTLAYSANIQYICTMLCGELLHQLYMLSV